MEIYANQTHYMTFPYITADLVRGDFTFELFKNGELITDIPIEIRAQGLNYTVSFENDGEDNVTWTMIVTGVAEPDVTIVETWKVRKRTIEKDVKQIKAKQEALGGFFAPKPEEE